MYVPHVIWLYLTGIRGAVDVLRGGVDRGVLPGDIPLVPGPRPRGQGAQRLSVRPLLLA